MGAAEEGGVGGRGAERPIDIRASRIFSYTSVTHTPARPSHTHPPARSLDHSVANMFMIPFGMMNGAEITIKQFICGNIIPVTLGNIVGGAVCVAGLYTYAFGKKASA